MSDRKSLSIQKEELLMEQIRSYLCLFGKSKMSFQGTRRQQKCME